MNSAFSTRAASLGVLVLFLGVPIFAHAHSEGASYEATAGDYFVDIGYSAPKPAAGEAVVFDFGLKSQGPDEPDFTDVWVKINAESGAVIFASGIHNADFGGPKMSYTFPAAGVYTISARYERGTEALADTSFTLAVSEAPDDAGGPPGSYPYVHLAVAFVGGCLAAFIAMRPRLRS